MVRRLKDDLREIVGGFPKRHVVQVDISDLPADSPELRIAALLDQYRALREERLAGESSAHAKCFRTADHRPAAAAVLFD